jgi:Flp pilus assembly protein TadG
MKMRRTIEKTSHFREMRSTILAHGIAIRDESGGAMVELALGLTVCVVLILGAAEFGRLAYAGIEISNAAHAGAEYGAQSHTTAADNTNMQLAATQDAPNVSGMTATASHSCVCADGTTSTCAASDCASSRVIVSVQVNTSAAVDPLFYVPGLPKSYTVTGKATMRVVQ